MVGIEHVADDLDVEIVLIGPEPRRIAVFAVCPGDIAGDADRLVLRIGPGLDADGAVVAFAPLQRHVAGAEHIGRRRPPVSVDLDAGIGGKAQITRDRIAGIDANSDQNDVRLQLGSVGQTDAVQSRCRDRGAKLEADAMVAMPRLDDVAHQSGERPGQQSRQALDHGNIAAVLGRGAGTRSLRWNDWRSCKASSMLRR